VAENETLRRENAGLRSMKLINPEYVKELEVQRRNYLSLLPLLAEFARGDETEMVETTLKRVLAEHARMKRQLELAESYNYDAVGTTDGSALYDLNNYVLLALGKPKMPLREWLMKQVERAMKRLELKPRRAPVFMDTSFDNDTFHSTLFWHRACGPSPLKYKYVISDPSSHQSDAYSPTGCADCCSHPDCKKATK